MPDPAAGLSLEPARFPGRAPIDAYGNNGFRFADMSHRGSILALPSGIEAWEVTEPAGITPDTVARLVAESKDIEVLLVGTGSGLVPLSAATNAALSAVGLWPDLMSTGAAVRTFNVLLAEGRAVAAALIAVDSIR